MQRITRLLSDPSSRARWRVPFTIGVLLVGVALVAGGTGISRHRLPNLHITSTTDGVLWHRLVMERGWTNERYADWLGRLWTRLLVEP